MKCDYCAEEFLRGERADCRPAALHVECCFRMVAGSVAHIKGNCSCHGDQHGDPPSMTRRQAAQAALSEYRKLHA